MSAIEDLMAALSADPKKLAEFRKQLRQEAEKNKRNIAGPASSALMGLSFNLPNQLAQTNLPGSGIAKSVTKSAQQYEEDFPKQATATGFMAGMASPLSKVTPFDKVTKYQGPVAKAAKSALNAGVQAGFGGANAGTREDYASNFGWNAAFGAGGATALNTLGVGAMKWLQGKAPAAQQAYKYIKDKVGSSMDAVAQKQNAIANENAPKILNNATRSHPELREDVRQSTGKMVEESTDKTARILQSHAGADFERYVDKVRRDIPAQEKAANAAFEAAKKTNVPYTDDIHNVLFPKNLNADDIYKKAAELASSQKTPELLDQTTKEINALRKMRKQAGKEVEPEGTGLFGPDGKEIMKPAEKPPETISANTLQVLKQASSDVYGATTVGKGVHVENTSQTNYVADMNKNLTKLIGDMSPELKAAWKLTERHKDESELLEAAKKHLFSENNSESKHFLDDMVKRYATKNPETGAEPSMNPSDVKRLIKMSVVDEMKKVSFDPSKAVPGSSPSDMLALLKKRGESLKPVLGEDAYNRLTGSLERETDRVAGAQAVGKKLAKEDPPAPLNWKDSPKAAAFGLYKTAANSLARFTENLIDRYSMTPEKARKIADAFVKDNGMKNLEDQAKFDNWYSKNAKALQSGFVEGTVQKGAGKMAAAGVNAEQGKSTPREPKPETPPVQTKYGSAAFVPDEAAPASSNAETPKNVVDTQYGKATFVPDKQ